MSVFAPSSADVPTRNYELGPKRCLGTTPLLGNWITRSIAAVWLVSFMTFHFFGCGVPFPYTFFFDFHRGIQGVRVSTNRAVAYPPMSLPSTCQTQLGRAVLGSNLFVLIFLFVRFLEICGESACMPHIPVGRPSHPWWGVQSLRENDGRITIG